MRRLLITVDESAFGEQPGAFVPVLGMSFLARSVLTSLLVVGEVVILVDATGPGLEERLRRRLGPEVAGRAALRIYRADDPSALRFLADDLIVVDWRTFVDPPLLLELFDHDCGEVARIGVELAGSGLAYPQLERFPRGLRELPLRVGASDDGPNERFGISRMPLRLTRMEDAETVADRLLVELTRPVTQVGVVRASLYSLLSLRLTRQLAIRGVSSNQLSTFSLILGLCGGALAAFFGGNGLIAASLAFLLVTLLDRSDGDLARLQHDSSMLGEWLDTLADDLAVLAFVIGVSWNLFLVTGAAWPLWLGSFASAATIAVFGMIYARVRLVTGSVRRSHYRWEISRRIDTLTGWRAVVMRGLRMALKRDVFAIVLCLLAIMQLQAPLLLAALALSCVAFIGVAVELVLVWKKTG